MKILISIDDDIGNCINSYCKHQGYSRNGMITMLLRNYIKENHNNFLEIFHDKQKCLVAIENFLKVI